MRGFTKSPVNSKRHWWRQTQWVREKWNDLSASMKEHQKCCCIMNREDWRKVCLVLPERWIRYITFPLTKRGEVKPLFWVEALHSYGVCWISIKGSFSSLFVLFVYSSLYLTYQPQPPLPSLPVPFSHPPPPSSPYSSPSRKKQASCKYQHNLVYCVAVKLSTFPWIQYDKWGTKSQ